MQTVKLQCVCGQKYTFDVEPVNGQMPYAVTCPSCGADGTEAANLVLAQSPGDSTAIPASELYPAAATPRRFTPGPPAGATTGSDRPVVHPSVTAREAKSGAYASNPGRLRPDWKQVLKARPAIWAVPLVVVVAGLAGGLLVHPGLFLGVAVAAWSLWDSCREIKALLMSGDVCPGLVISERPERVAVMTNLSATGKHRPVVRILEQPLSKMAGGPMQAGTRVAAVAFYLGPLTPSGDWKFFKPEVINWMVSDPVEIGRVMSSIPEEEWQALETYVRQLPSEKTGMYAMWGPKPSATEAMARGERRAVWLAVALLVVIGMATAMALISYMAKPREPGAQAAPSPASGRFERPSSPMRPADRPFPDPGRSALPGRPSQTGFAGISVGDKVEVMERGRWMPGTATKIEGFRFLIHFDESGKADQWIDRGLLKPKR